MCGAERFLDQISTHTLARRVTRLKKLVDVVGNISTHTLARRVTVPGIRLGRKSSDFNPHPRTEGDRGRRPCRRRRSNFNPHPRTEGDRKGIANGTISVISTHTLARRVTARDGGTDDEIAHFNPHPRTEGDWCSAGRQGGVHPRDGGTDDEIAHFNPHPRTEGDCEVVPNPGRPAYFNPHPRTEGDQGQ